MSGVLAVGLGAAAGALGALCAREVVLATPRLARWLAAAVAPLHRAGREGYAPSDRERQRLALVGSAAIGSLVLVVAGSGPLILAVLAGPPAAASALAGRRRRYRRAVDGEIPGVATALADAIASGGSVRAALTRVSLDLEGPAAGEMCRVAADLELGAGTVPALEGMAARIGSERARGFATVLVSQQRAGGDVTALLRRFAAAAADRDRTAADARSATAQARFTSLLVVALPGGAALFAELLSPGFLGSVFADRAAMALMVAAAGLQLAGFWVIRRFAGAGAGA